LRNYDVIASRIDDIIAKGMPDPACDPQRTPLSPPLCADQLRALENIYDIPAVLKDGFTYNVGRWKGPEVLMEESIPMVCRATFTIRCRASMKPSIPAEEL